MELHMWGDLHSRTQSEEASNRTRPDATGSDGEILKVARELCLDLKINRFEPEGIRWVTWLLVPHSKMFLPSDQCFFEDSDVASQLALKGQLTANEWKPLIASSLIYEFDRRMRRRLSLLRPLRLGLVLIAALVPFAIFRLAFPNVQLPILSAVGLVFLELFALNLLFWDFSLARKRLRLESDQKAAVGLGRDVFLSTLRKIDSIRLADVEARKLEKTSGWSLGRSQWPSITQRIENLQPKA